MSTVELESSIRVAVIAADPVLRGTCVNLFDATPDCLLVALVQSVAEAVLAIPPLEPDVVVLHVGRQRTTEAVAAIDPALACIAAPIVIFSTDGSRRQPAGGVSRSPEELLDAVRSHGQRDGATRGDGSAAGHPAGAATLTLREREVVDLIVRSYSYKEIARRLGIGVSTIGTHMHHIYEKLGVSSRRGIVEAFQHAAVRGPAADHISRRP